MTIQDNKCLWKKSLEDKTSTSFNNPDPSLKCLSCNGFDCLYEPSRYVKDKLRIERSDCLKGNYAVKLEDEVYMCIYHGKCDEKIMGLCGYYFEENEKTR